MINLDSINNFNRSMSSSNFQQQQEKNDSSIIITIDSDDQMERSQMSEELRSSTPNGFVEVDIGNFAPAIEKVKNRDIEKLYVKENGLEDGFIRKYMKQGGKWKCCRCISNTTSRKRSNSSTVHNHRYGRIREAIETGNKLYVSKAHSSNSCKPYPQEDFEFPLCEEKPNVNVLNAANSAPVVFQIPDLSSPSLAAASSVSTTQDHVASSFTNSIPSSVPCSSRTLLYSTNPANNPMSFGSTRLPPRSPRRVESIGHSVTQQQPQTPASTVSSLTPQRAQPETATVPQQPTQETDDRHTVIQQPSPANITSRSDNDPGHITEDAKNYEDKENVQNNLRERSIASIPEDPVGPISIKPEKNDVASNDDNSIENMEIERKYEIFSFPDFSEKPLKAACKKLNIHDSYSKNQVLLVWSNIVIQVVKSRSDSINSGEKLNGFECLSLLLTGSQENSYELYGNLKAKLENDQEMKAHYNVAQRRVMSKKFCEEHLELIAHWISCRIGIYEHGTLKKYGDWSRSRPSNDLILLIEKDGDKYAPILSL